MLVISRSTLVFQHEHESLTAFENAASFQYAAGCQEAKCHDAAHSSKSFEAVLLAVSLSVTGIVGACASKQHATTTPLTQRTCSQLPAGTPNSNSCEVLVLLLRRMTEALAASPTAVAGNCMQHRQHIADQKMVFFKSNGSLLICRYKHHRTCQGACKKAVVRVMLDACTSR